MINQKIFSDRYFHYQTSVLAVNEMPGLCTPGTMLLNKLFDYQMAHKF